MPRVDEQGVGDRPRGEELAYSYPAGAERVEVPCGPLVPCRRREHEPLDGIVWTRCGEVGDEAVVPCELLPVPLASRPSAATTSRAEISRVSPARFLMATPEIQPAGPYPEDYEAVVSQAQRERDTGYERPFKETVPNLQSYELVYLDERVAAGELPQDSPPPNRVSLLSRIRVVGHDGDRTSR